MNGLSNLLNRILSPVTSAQTSNAVDTALTTVQNEYPWLPYAAAGLAFVWIATFVLVLRIARR